MAIGLALLAAALFGLGTVAQARAAYRLSRAPVGRRRRFVTDVGWLGGTLCSGAGVLAHTLALRYGSLLLVQPIVYSALLVALSAEAVLRRRLPVATELIGAGQVAAGLAALTLLLHVPNAARPAAAVPVLATVGLLAVGGWLLLRGVRRRRRSPRAARWGLAAGAAMGLSSVLVRSTAVAVASHGAAGLLSWSVPGLLAAGAAGLLLEQRAYAEGRLAAALGPQDAAGLLLSVGLGAILLGDLPHPSAAAAACTVIALLLVTRGVLRLARSQGTDVRPTEVASTAGTAGSPADNRLLTGPAAR